MFWAQVTKTLTFCVPHLARYLSIATSCTIKLDPRMKDKDKNRNDDPPRKSIALMPIIITPSHVDNIILPATSGHLVFMKGQEKFPDCITNLVDNFNEQSTCRKKDTVFELI